MEVRKCLDCWQQHRLKPADRIAPGDRLLGSRPGGGVRALEASGRWSLASIRVRRNASGSTAGSWRLSISSSGASSAHPGHLRLLQPIGPDHSGLQKSGRSRNEWRSGQQQFLRFHSPVSAQPTFATTPAFKQPIRAASTVWHPPSRSKHSASSPKVVAAFSSAANRTNRNRDHANTAQNTCRPPSTPSQ